MAWSFNPFTGNFDFTKALAVEVPSGAVNGSNASFTVQFLPVYVEVSGQLMVSKDTDATNYGYTVSGSGPYTITFITAPASTQTPHSFHE